MSEISGTGYPRQGEPTATARATGRPVRPRSERWVPCPRCGGNEGHVDDQMVWHECSYCGGEGGHAVDIAPRGVWWRLLGSVVHLDFTGKDNPPPEPESGPDWQWADETMVVSDPDALDALTLVPSTREPDPPVEWDGVYVSEASYDPETGAWITDDLLPEVTESGESADLARAGAQPDTTDSEKDQVDP